MKLIDMTCPHCGGTLKINPDNRNCVCNYCGAKLILDNETLHLQFDNAYESGYQFEKGRQRAQAEANRQYTASQPSYSAPRGKKAPTWLWVLGWIFIFPIPLTILMLRNKNMDNKAKYGIIAAAWIAYLCIGAFGGANKSNNNDSNTNSNPVITSVESSNSEITTTNKAQNNAVISESTESTDSGTESTTTEKDNEIVVESQQDALDNCVKTMNTILSEELLPVATFDPQDTESGHYRTEFRLLGFKDAIGQSYSYGDATVDIIVETQAYFDTYYPIRVYTITSDFDQNLELFKAAAIAMDAELSDDDLQEAVNYLIEHRSANGYYFSNLGLLFNSSEMMLKYKND